MTSTYSPQQRLQLLTLKSQKTKAEHELAVQFKRIALPNVPTQSPTRILALQSASMNRIDFEKKQNEIQQKLAIQRQQMASQFIRKQNDVIESCIQQQQLDKMQLNQQQRIIDKIFINAEQNRQKVSSQRHVPDKQQKFVQDSTTLAMAQSVLQHADQLRQKALQTQSEQKKKLTTPEQLNQHVETDLSKIFQPAKFQHLSQKAEMKRCVSPQKISNFDQRLVKEREEALVRQKMYEDDQRAVIKEIYKKMDANKQSLSIQEKAKPDYLTKQPNVQQQQKDIDFNKQIWREIDELKASSMDPKQRIAKIDQLMAKLRTVAGQ